MSERTTKLFEINCVNCHALPNTTAPLIGDINEWQIRKNKGLDTLLNNTIDGFGRMPPLGSCSACDADDFRALVGLLAGIKEEDHLEH